MDIHDLIIKEKADMCGLVETKVDALNERFIKHSLPKGWDWVGNAEVGQRHRIVVGWKNSN